MLFLNRLRSKIGVMMKKKWILPVIAGVIVIIALAVIFLVPKKSEEPGLYADQDQQTIRYKLAEFIIPVIPSISYSCRF